MTDLEALSPHQLRSFVRKAQEEAERMRSYIAQLQGTNGALMNEIDRLGVELAQERGWVPPPEPEPSYWVPDSAVDWTTAEVVDVKHGDRRWRLATAEGWKVFELKPYPSRVEGVELAPYWSPMGYRSKADALAEIARRVSSVDNG
jgi:hypothetical protein